MRRTLSVRPSVRLSVRPSVCLSVRLSVRPSVPLSYFSARTEGRISYSHLGRTDSCYYCYDRRLVRSTSAPICISRQCTVLLVIIITSITIIIIIILASISEKHMQRLPALLFNYYLPLFIYYC